MTAPDVPRSLTARAVWPLFWVHTALIVFSTIALVTFVADLLTGQASPELTAWIQQEPNATVYRLGWTYSGPTYIVIGVMAALAHAVWLFGGRRAALMFGVASLIALGSELLGTSTGYPFGGYRYTDMLGYRILGLVPFPIPISWTYILYCGLAMCGRLLPARDDMRTRLVWAVVAGLILTAWDVAMDPAMVVTNHWVWFEPGQFYGMPYTNWIGWLVTGIVIAWVMMLFVKPSEFARQAAPSRFPIALYAVNGIMPIAICARYGFTWAVVFGTLAMAIPVALALRAGRPASDVPDPRPAGASRDLHRGPTAAGATR